MSLTTVQEIERAIAALTPQQLAELYAWLDQYDPQPIDARLKADLDAGRIDDASPAPSPTTRPETPNHSSGPRHDPPGERGLLERL